MSLMAALSQESVTFGKISGYLVRSSKLGKNKENGKEGKCKRNKVKPRAKKSEKIKKGESKRKC
jgi:hypothetical protein